MPQLRQRGIEAIVVLIHEGGFPTGDYNECPGISGPIVDIVGKLDKAVDLVVSGHTHRAYKCVIDGRLVTSADKFGTIVTEIEIELDPKTRDVVSAKADNLIVRTEAYAKDPEQTALIAAYDVLVKPLAERPVGSITATLSRDEGPGRRKRARPDHHRRAAGRNPVGAEWRRGDRLHQYRRHPHEPGQELRRRRGHLRRSVCRPAVRQSLVTLTLTGAQIKTLLEQQWLNQPKPRVLQVSSGFSYTWDDRRPRGDFVAAEGITLHGRPLDPASRATA